MVVGLELETEGVRLHHGDSQVAGLELGGGHLSPPLGLRKAQHTAVEVDRGIEVPRRDRDEVGARDQRRRRGHGVAPWLWLSRYGHGLVLNALMDTEKITGGGSRPRAVPLARRVRNGTHPP